MAWHREPDVPDAAGLGLLGCRASVLGVQHLPRTTGGPGKANGCTGVTLEVEAGKVLGLAALKRAVPPACR